MDAREHRTGAAGSGRAGAAAERRSRVLRAGLFQVLWALLLVYLILAGIGGMIGREAGTETALIAVGGLAVLVTASFLLAYAVDRVTAELDGHFRRKADRSGTGGDRSTRGRAPA